MLKKKLKNIPFASSIYQVSFSYYHHSSTCGSCSEEIHTDTDTRRDIQKAQIRSVHNSKDKYSIHPTQLLQGNVIVDTHNTAPSPSQIATISVTTNYSTLPQPQDLSYYYHCYPTTPIVPCTTCHHNTTSTKIAITNFCTPACTCTHTHEHTYHTPRRTDR